VPSTQIPENMAPLIWNALVNRNQARGAATKAHAPHSHFTATSVITGAPSGTIHCRSNVKNSSYGITVCGERRTLFNAIAKDFRRIKYLAV
jgi:cytidine deaminase